MLLCFVAGAAAAGFVASRETKQYQATSQLLFRNDSAPDQSLQAVFGLPGSATAPDAAQQAATNVAAVSLGTVADLTASALGQNLTGADVASQVSVAEVGQSNIISITATDSSPTRAATVANTYARQYIAFSQSVDRSLVLNALHAVEQQLANLAAPLRPTAGRALTSRIQQLSALAGLQNGNAQLVGSASVPSSPSSPNTKQNIGLGGLLGLIVGVALAVLLYRLDRRAKDPEEIAEAYDLPLLGVVPRTRELRTRRRDLRTWRRDGAKSWTTFLPAQTADAFRAVRARLRYFNVDHELRSLLVTSAVEGEGKSTVARQLARVVAMQGNAKVLLIETDLRQPSLADAHGLQGVPGLAELLSGGSEVETVIQHVPASGGGLAARRNGHAASGNGAAAGEYTLTEYRADADRADEEVPMMDVIVAGAIPPNPSELLDSDAMLELVHTLADRYSLMILDAPPGSVVSDMLPLVSLVSGVIVVSSMRHGTRDAAEPLRSQIESAGASMLGVVVNNAKRPRRDQYSGYRRRNGTTITAGAGTFHDAGANGGAAAGDDVVESEHTRV